MAAKIKSLWIQGLTSGMDQSSDPSLVVNNESPLLKNVTLDQPGNWVTRKGTSRLGNRVTASDRVWGLGVYNSTDGSTRKLMMVTQRDLYAYNESTGIWDSKDTDEWPADTRVDFINHINRLYVGSDDGVTALSYTTGGEIIDVTPTIGGSILAVNKNILAVGGNSIKPNVIFYTNPFTDTFYAATGTCAANADIAGANTVTTTTGIFEADMVGSIIYNTTDGEMALITSTKVGGVSANTVVQTDSDTSGWDNDTVYILQNNFKLDGKCTGLVSYKENFIAWDEDKIYFWDATSNWSDDEKNFGCVNYRTVQVVNGLVIWVNREGVYSYDPQRGIRDITGKIRDEVNGYGIWDLINDSNWGQFASGVFPGEGIYRLSIGDLETLPGAPASGLTNAELEFDTTRETWTVNSYPDAGVVYVNFINTNGAKNLYRGDKGTSAVYKLKTGTTDANNDGSTTAISFDFRTPHHVLGDPRVKNKIKKYFIKYVADNTVTLEISKNRESYESLRSFAASSAVTGIERRPRAAQEGFSHSLKFTGTGKLSLEGYGFETQIGTTTRLPTA